MLRQRHSTTTANTNGLRRDCNWNGPWSVTHDITLAAATATTSFACPACRSGTNRTMTAAVGDGIWPTRRSRRCKTFYGGTNPILLFVAGGSLIGPSRNVTARAVPNAARSCTHSKRCANHCPIISLRPPVRLSQHRLPCHCCACTQQRRRQRQRRVSNLLLDAEKTSGDGRFSTARPRRPARPYTWRPWNNTT
jgi:hypothetical protein